MKILIIGAAGMVGHALMRVFRANNLDVEGTARGKQELGLIDLDLNNWDKFKHFILNNPFELIFNCSGVLVRESEVDKPRSVYINSLFPHLLTDLLKNSPTKVIHLSTGGVFSGSDEYIFEDAPLSPPTFYGLTKAAGEFNNGKDLVVRSDFWGPDRKKSGGGIFNWFLNQKDAVKAYESVYFNGISSIEFAKIAPELTGFSGVLHVGAEEIISKAALLRKIKERFKLNIPLISDGTAGKKVALKSRSVLPRIGSYDSMVTDIYRYLRQNSDLYRDVYPQIY